MTNIHRARLDRVFVDSSAFFAIVRVRDTNHAAALAIMARLATERRHLFTTNFVVAESHALILIRVGHHQADLFLAEIDRGATVIVRVSARDERRAREIIRQYEDKDFSLTDATSFAVMERLRIGHAFTFDSDFLQYGIPTLRA